jgi:hypothetical protein
MPNSHQMNNDSSKSNTSKTASIAPSTTQLLDLFISKQAELKALDTFVGELRKQIQTAIELGELKSLDDAGRYVYENLQIQVVERKTWRYSPAVDQLKEKEQFNGNATQSTNASYRFVVKDS